jgi:aspartyl-tRNA(Asn)/glutamyl-tRNA(Gln) amidotransferase subunit A
MSVAGLTSAFSSRQSDPVEALDFCLQRIERINPALNAFLGLRERAARDEAEASAARWKNNAPLSRVDGVPFGVKANIAVAGSPLHAGIAAYKDDIAKDDAAVVATLKRAGAIPVGMLNMHEGALGATTDNPHFGRCRNPWNQTLTPGGSSGGSAAAVAAGLIPFALGTDTMGSVRIPSAYCGVVGFKPGRGRISDAGVLALSPTLDHVGVHAPTAQDAALVAAALFDVEADSQAPIAIGRWGDTTEVDRDVTAGFEAAARLLERNGKRPSTDVAGFDFGALRRRGLLISEVEGFRIHQARLAAARAGFSPEFAGMLEWGAGQPKDRIGAAYAAVAEAGARFAALVDAAGVLVLPTAPQGPFAFGAPTPPNQADFTCLANFAGLPAIAVPASVAGAPPASIQFIASRGRDGWALATACAFENARGPAPLARTEL